MWQRKVSAESGQRDLGNDCSDVFIHSFKADQDGRQMKHNLLNGRAIGNYQVSDAMDGALVIAMEHVTYNGGAIYDLLPTGSTGLYWANGILLKSTLTNN